ncbi:hypothetical protein ACFSTH_11570 [Paenibacillus yanchengensis]|uniref:RHS repeat protein n=1 Tax=Paenibacillus yanchengensis TaxID=2035833 RepID=A0ABW4YIZ8_9BACL
MHTTGTTSYQYDPYTCDLTTKTFADGKTMTYTYNMLGQRTKLKTPFDDEIGYTYTSVNQLQQLTWNSIVEADYEYYLNGQAQKEEQGNGVNVARTYDQFKLATLQYKNEATNLGQQYRYDYDQAGNITNRQATKQSVVMEDNTITYDALSRIATSTLFDESYTYDKRGNRSGKLIIFTNVSLVIDISRKITLCTTCECNNSMWFSLCKYFSLVVK